MLQLRARLPLSFVRQRSRKAPQLQADEELATLLGPPQRLVEACKIDISHTNKFRPCAGLMFQTVNNPIISAWPLRTSGELTECQHELLISDPQPYTMGNCPPPETLSIRPPSIRHKRTSSVSSNSNIPTPLAYLVLDRLYYRLWATGDRPFRVRTATCANPLKIALRKMATTHHEGTTHTNVLRNHRGITMVR